MLQTEHIGAELLLRTWVTCGLKEVVLSPGSRNAPLVIAAAQFPELKLITALDERSAAHIALGLALQTRRPALVISTSGTAAINHGPGIAEAHFQRIPLISVTADRPIQARNSGPGQFVHQTNLFAAHTEWSTELNELTAAPNEIVRTALDAWQHAQSGPVHVNLPMDEPLYGMRECEAATMPDLEEPLGAQAAREVAQEADPMPEALADLLNAYDVKVLLHVGASTSEKLTEDMALELSERCGLVVDAFGCMSHVPASSPAHWMAAWSASDPERWRPDVILTTGLPPMDKQLRAHLTRWNVPHWHLGEHDHAWDMFHSLAGHWKRNALSALVELSESMAAPNAYAGNWQVQQLQIERAETQLHDEEWTDFNAFRFLAHHLADEGVIHCANSTSARYAQWFNWGQRRLHANRGVAGIDGCLSTAVGDALQHPDHSVVLLTGDAAWLYDANGLHVTPQPSNLKVIVINNGGGNIFRWLDGPRNTGLLEPHFEASFAQNVRGSAEQLGMSYHVATDQESLRSSFSAWHNNPGLALLEIQTPGAASAQAQLQRMRNLAEALKKSTS